jgi:hypothetical protein
MPRKRKVATTRARKGSGAQSNGKSIFQITPIIIKGASVDVDSPLLDFEDDDGKRVPHYKIRDKGRISEVTIKGDAVVKPRLPGKPLDITINGANVTIGITFLRQT